MRVKLSFFTIIYLIFSTCIIVSLIYPKIYLKQHLPLNLVTVYPDGDVYDYYVRLSIILDGTRGHLLYNDRYTPDTLPSHLALANYAFTGYIFSPFHWSVAKVYYVSKFIGLGMLFVVMYIFIKKIFFDTVLRILATVLFFCYSEFYMVSNNASLTIREYIPYAYTFNVYKRFLIPPHHIFALTGMTIMLICVMKNNWTYKKILLSCFCCILAGLLHPPILMACILTFVGAVCFNLFYKKSIHNYIPYFIHICSIFPVIGYYWYIFHYTLPWSAKYAASITTVPSLPFYSYIMSLGPLLYVSIIGFIFLLFQGKQIIWWMLAFWAYGPIVIFSLARFGLPIEDVRTFQTDQYVPLSLLSSYGIYSIISHIQNKRIKSVLYFIVILVVFIFASFSFTTELSANADTKTVIQDYHVGIPLDTIKAFNFLDKKTPIDSIVLGGRYSNNMIPAFTHNRVLYGINASNEEIMLRMQFINNFYIKNITKNDVEIYMKKYNILYVFFGEDEQLFTHSLSLPYPNIFPVFQSGKTIIYQVKQ